MQFSSSALFSSSEQQTHKPQDSTFSFEQLKCSELSSSQHDETIKLKTEPNIAKTGKKSCTQCGKDDTTSPNFCQVNPSDPSSVKLKHTYCDESSGEKRPLKPETKKVQKGRTTPDMVQGRTTPDLVNREKSPTPRVDEMMRRSNLSLSQLSLNSSVSCPKHGRSKSPLRRDKSLIKSCLKTEDVSPARSKKQTTF